MRISRTFLQRGNVVLVTFPFTDLSGSKKRPAIVLQNETSRSLDLILAFISSVVPESPGSTEVVLTPKMKDFALTGLKVPSVIRLDKLATIERRLVARKLGSVTQTYLKQVDSALIRALEISLAPHLLAERQRLAQIAQNQGHERLLAELLR